MQEMLEDLAAKWRDGQGTFAGVLEDVDPQAADACSRAWAEANGRAASTAFFPSWPERI
jgi:hypothetical protein